MRALSGALIIHMSTYAFSPHVHAALLNGVYVLLDEHADRYLCMTEQQSRLLAAILRGEGGPEADRFTDALVTRKILSRPERSAASASRPCPPASSAFGQKKAGTLLPGEWLALLQAVRDTRDLRKRRLTDRLHKIREQKSGPGASDTPSTEDAGAAAARFNGLCDLFLTRTDACLPRSLLLTGFLLRRHIPADLVIGVKLGPFAAHAWVEYGGCVLNDHLETVQEYVPILRV